MADISEAVLILSKVEDNLCSGLVSDFEVYNPILGFYRHVLATFSHSLIDIRDGDNASAVNELRKINDFNYNGKKMYKINNTVKPLFKKRDIEYISGKTVAHIGLLKEEDYNIILKIFDDCRKVFRTIPSLSLEDYHFLGDAFYFLSSIEYFHCTVVEARKELPFRFREVTQELEKVLSGLGNVVSDVQRLLYNYPITGIRS